MILEESDLDVWIELCLDGYRLAVKVSNEMELDTSRLAFVSSLRKFTLLGSSKEMKNKNLAAVKVLLTIAHQDGNQLKESWIDVLQSISEVERLHLVGAARPDGDVFRTAASNGGSGGGGGGGSGRLRESDSVNSLAIHRIDAAAIDRVFTSSAKLDEKAIIDFVMALRQISEVELSNAQQPRVFALQKIVEITSYNMGRIRLVWNRIWAIISEYFIVRAERAPLSPVPPCSVHCTAAAAHPSTVPVSLSPPAVLPSEGEPCTDGRVGRGGEGGLPSSRSSRASRRVRCCQAGCHPNLQVSIFAIDSVRQLAMKFLEKDELASYQFQKQFFKPFEAIMLNNPSPDTRELIVQCLERMIASRVHNIKSGWKAVFVVLGIAARQSTPPLVHSAFDLLLRIMEQYFALITESSSDTMDECVNCLVAFGCNPLTDVAQKAIHRLQSVADFLGQQVVTAQQAGGGGGAAASATQGTRKLSADMRVNYNPSIDPAVSDSRCGRGRSGRLFRCAQTAAADPALLFAGDCWRPQWRWGHCGHCRLLLGLGSAHLVPSPHRPLPSGGRQPPGRPQRSPREPLRSAQRTRRPVLRSHLAPHLLRSPLPHLRVRAPPTPSHSHHRTHENSSVALSPYALLCCSALPRCALAVTKPLSFRYRWRGAGEGRLSFTRRQAAMDGAGSLRVCALCCARSLTPDGFRLPCASPLLCCLPSDDVRHAAAEGDKAGSVVLLRAEPRGGEELATGQRGGREAPPTCSSLTAPPSSASHKASTARISPSSSASGAAASPATAGESSWLQTTCYAALFTLVELFHRFHVSVNFLLPELLSLIASCIDGESDDLARIGLKCLVVLCQTCGPQLSVQSWWLVLDAVMDVLRRLQPQQLQSNDTRALLGLPPVSLQAVQAAVRKGSKGQPELIAQALATTDLEATPPPPAQPQPTTSSPAVAPASSAAAPPGEGWRLWHPLPPVRDNRCPPAALRTRPSVL